MATEINKDLFDNLIHQQIAIGRYSSRQAREMVGLLNAANKEVIAKLQKWGDSERFTPTRLKRLLAEIKQLAAETYATAGDTLRSEMLPFAEHSAEVAGAMLATQLPVDWSDVKMSKEQIAAMFDSTPIRIGKNQALLFDEYFKVLASGFETKVRGAINLGVSQGESIQQITDRLINGTKFELPAFGTKNNGPRRDIYNLAHTVVQHVNNQAAAATMMNNSEVLKGFLSVVTFDSKSCQFCVKAATKEYKLTDIGPTWHIGCRCFRAPLVKTWKELGYSDMPEYPTGTRATSTGQVRADLSFNDWLKDQPRKTQVELLGPVRGKMFADGKLTLDKFTDNSGKLYTLEQLKGH